MANMQVGAKAIGTGAGLVAAINYAPEATTVSMAQLGYAVDPATLQSAVESLVNGGWIGVLGFVGLIGGLIGQSLIRRAQARWGEPDSTPAVPAAPPAE
jgi:hypothetical protein